MKRSRINTILVDALDFLDAHQFALPQFARLTPSELRERAAQGGSAGIFTAGLGWLVTDYGLDDFPLAGLVTLVTRRGGASSTTPQGACIEQQTIVRAGQRTPHHRYRTTQVDVAGRSGSPLTVRLHLAMASGDLDTDTALTVVVDGQERALAPGAPLNLHPGQNLAVPPEIYREYSAEAGDALVTELVSGMAREDDTMFFDPVGVAMEIEEDEAARYLLVRDYPAVFSNLQGK